MLFVSREICEKKMLVIINVNSGDVFREREAGLV